MVQLDAGSQERLRFKISAQLRTAFSATEGLTT